MRLATLLTLAVLSSTACGVPEVGVAPPGDELSYPVSLMTLPNAEGPYLYIANAVFDRRYNQGTIAVYDTERHVFVEEATTEIGLLAGKIAIHDERTGEGGALHAYAAIRDKGALLQLSIDVEAEDPSDMLKAGGRFDTFGERAFADDPYDLAVDDRGMMVSHLGPGVVSYWYFVRDDDTSSANGQLSFGCSRNLPRGATYIERHPGTDWWYVTDRSADRIYAVSVRSAVENDGSVSDGQCEIVLEGSIAVNSLSTRGLAFSPTGTSLFVTSEVDNSVRVYDTSIGANGTPRNRLVDSIAIGGAGNVIRFAPPGESGGSSLVYVTMFYDDELIVIDPNTRLIVDRVEVGRGAHDIAFIVDPAGRLKVYVANFEDFTVSVVDASGAPGQFSMSEIIQ